MRGYSSCQAIETAAGVKIRTDNVWGFKNNNAVTANYKNRAVKIDIPSQIVKTDLNHNSRINGDSRLTFGWDCSYVRHTNVFIARGNGRVRPFSGVFK